MAKGKYNEWITESGLQIIEQWARDGLTEEQIAGNIGICRDTLNEWKNRFPAISDAIKKGKAPVDFQVENALLKRARGYEYLAEKPPPGKVARKAAPAGKRKERSSTIAL